MLHRVVLVSALSLLLSIIIATIWLVITFRPLSAQPARFLANNQPAELDLFYSGNVPFGSALIYLDTKPILLTPMLFTIYFDLNRDGVFEPAEELGVDHAAAFAEEHSPTGFPVSFDQSANPTAQFLRLQSAEHQIPIRVVLSALDNPMVPVEIANLRAKPEKIDIADVFSPEGSLIGGRAGRRTAAQVGRLREFFNLPVVHAQQSPGIRTGVPDINSRKGKKNECVPIAAANSLRWLATQPNFAGNLPRRDDDLLDALDSALGYVDNIGTDRSGFMAGKNAFTSAHNLNLNNQELDATITNGASDICALMQQEFSAAEDVELVIDFKDTPQSKTATGSHAVTVVGVQQGQNGSCSITVHDPFTPGKPKEENYKVGRDGRINHPAGEGKPGFGVVIFSESIKKKT
jgi:hypothetical protein